MRRAARKDNNQAAIEAALRAIGCSVADTSRAGNGFPDMVVGYQGVNFLFEVKNPEQSPAGRALTEDQQDFSDSWRGSYHVVMTIDEAMRIVCGG